jgi:hypothetical protein
MSGLAGAEIETPPSDGGLERTNVRYWPRADMGACAAHVRFLEQADMTVCGSALSRSVFGAKRTLVTADVRYQKKSGRDNVWYQGSLLLDFLFWVPRGYKLHTCRCVRCSSACV